MSIIIYIIVVVVMKQCDANNEQNVFKGYYYFFFNAQSSLLEKPVKMTLDHKSAESDSTCFCFFSSIKSFH